MIINNWLSFLRKQKGLFIILMISQILSLVCIYFVFGIFQNNLYELSANHDTKLLEASLKGCSIQPSQLKNIFVKLVDEYGFSIDYFYVDAESEDGTWEYQDRAQYKDGKFSYSDSVWENIKNDVEGSMADSVQYENADKVVVVNPEVKEEIGKNLKLGGEAYKIIGFNGINSEGELEIPFTAFPGDSRWKNLHIGMEMLPTRTEYERFCAEMEELGAEPSEFYIQNNADLKREYSMIVVSVLLALLAGGNMYMIYRYIFRKRRKKLAVYVLCGCSKTRARRMFFCEILLNILLVIVVGTLFFRFLVYPFMLSWFEYMSMVYGMKEYVIICIIFLAVTLSIGCILSKNMSKRSVIELRKEGA